MPGNVRIGGVWREVAQPYVRVGGTWREVEQAWTRVGGVWREWFSAFKLWLALTQTTNYATSPDGITWTARTRALAGNANANGFIGGLIVSGSGSGTYSTSPDGITWTTRNLYSGVDNFNNAPMATDGTTLLAALQGSGLGDLATTTNGTSFTQRLRTFNGMEYRGLTYGNNLWVALGTDFGGQTQGRTSPDTITWTNRSFALSNFAGNALTFGNNLFVAASTNGRISTSSDGVTWTQRSNPLATFNTTILDLTFGNNTYVAVGLSSSIITSTNGITWTSRTAGFSAIIRSVKFGNGLFVLGADGGRLSTSTDGATWTARTPNLGTNQIGGVFYAQK